MRSRMPWVAWDTFSTTTTKLYAKETNSPVCVCVRAMGGVHKLLLQMKFLFYSYLVYVLLFCAQLSHLLYCNGGDFQVYKQYAVIIILLKF